MAKEVLLFIYFLLATTIYGDNISQIRTRVTVYVGDMILVLIESLDVYIYTSIYVYIFIYLIQI